MTNKPANAADIASKLNNPKSGYINPRPEPVDLCPGCEVCGGSGFVRNDVHINHPEFGKLIVCPKRAPRAFAEVCGIEFSELKKLTWKNVEDRPGNKIAKSTLMHTLNPANPARKSIVYLHGGYGVGKTFLLQTAIAETVRAGIAAVYVPSLSGVMDNLRESYEQENSGSVLAARMEHWKTVPILAIDEIDRVKMSEFVSEKLFSIMDARYKTAKKNKTITLVASNEPPEIFDGYLASRFRDVSNAVIEIKDSDLRKRS